MENKKTADRKELWLQMWACVARLERELQESPDELCWSRREVAPPSLLRLDNEAANADNGQTQNVSVERAQVPMSPIWDVQVSKSLGQNDSAKTPKKSIPVVSTLISSSNTSPWMDAIVQCQVCNLGKEATCIRKQAIVGYPQQPQQARLLLVCDVPNYDADRQGLPLPPDNLEYLKKWLEAIQMVDNYYLTNLVKCRTPGNRAAWPEEIKSCAVHLQKQLEVFQPQAILAMGSSAARSLSQQRSDLNTLRSQDLYYSFQNKKIRLFVTYSVAEVLHNSDELRPFVWQDLKRLRAYLQQSVV